MALSNLQYLGTVLLANVSHGFGTLELQSFIDQEVNVQLAFARALEVEASKVMFSFSAGDVSVDKTGYARTLRLIADQVRQDYAKYGGEPSEAFSWSGSATFGTEEVEDFIDTDYNEPDL